MKNKVPFMIMFTLISNIAFSQTTGTLYKADKWADIKGKGDWVEAMENPTYEKVEILKTEQYIKVTFGTKVYAYQIVSSNRFSELKTDYTVTYDGKTYVLSIAEMMNDSYTINIEGVWMVTDIREVKTIEIE